jgi:hypothetical protein
LFFFGLTVDRNKNENNRDEFYSMPQFVHAMYTSSSLTGWVIQHKARATLAAVDWAAMTIALAA